MASRITFAFIFLVNILNLVSPHSSSSLHPLANITLAVEEYNRHRPNRQSGAKSDPGNDNGAM